MKEDASCSSVSSRFGPRERRCSGATPFGETGTRGCVRLAAIAFPSTLQSVGLSNGCDAIQHTADLLHQRDFATPALLSSLLVKVVAPEAL